MHQRPPVDPLQALAQGLEGGGVDQVGLAHQDAVGKADLGLGDGFLQVTLGVGGVHQGDDAVQHVALAEFLVGEEGLRHRRRIGQAGALDHQAVEVDFAVVAALQQEEQGLFQVGVDRAADAAVGQRHHLHRLDAEQLAVDRCLAVLVLDHRDLHAVLGLQQVLEQGGLAGAEEAGEHGDGDRGVVVVGYFGHAQLPEKTRATSDVARGRMGIQQQRIGRPLPPP